MHLQPARAERARPGGSGRCLRCRAAGIRPSSPSEERGERAERRARRALLECKKGMRGRVAAPGRSRSQRRLSRRHPRSHPCLARERPRGGPGERRGRRNQSEPLYCRRMSDRKGKRQFMEAALSEAYRGCFRGDGGPFGAVVVSKGEIVARGHNEVLKQGEPTRHAEMCAIAKAAPWFRSHLFLGASIYSPTQPS